MRFDRENETANRLLFANLAWIAAGCLVAAQPANAQQTGVSVAQPVTVVDTQPDPAPAKPSAGIPAAAPSAPVVYGAYVPYHAPGTPAPAPEKAFDPDSAIVTADSGSHRRPLSSANDPDAGIVTHVPTQLGEINDGTVIKTRLRETLSTLSTRPGTRFTAEVSEPVMQDNRIYIPMGSVLEGRVTMVRGGKRISGGAAIHLEPDHVTLPDGTIYPLHARAIDTSSWQNTKVDEEGTIVRRDSGKGVLEAGGLTTGGAMAAGAVIAGAPGALIGAGIGAGATAVVWLRRDRQAELPRDLGVIFSLTAPMAAQPTHAELPAPPATHPMGGE